MSGFAWLDYSEHERRKALDVIDLFREKDTRDELGIGTVRDALADRLFPGISTIQTRARYFLFIPWVHQGLEADHTRSVDAPRIARHREIRLIHALLESNDHEGIIGREAIDKLQRLPSEIYWSGLARLGMRKFQGSLSHYYRSLDDFYESHRHRKANVDDGIAEAFAHRVNWHESLPSALPEFPADTTLALTCPEAEYLQQQFLSQVPDSMLAWLVDQEEIWQSVDYPWLHPDVAAVDGSLGNALRHARNFSLVMHGALLLYNLMLAEKRAGTATNPGSNVFDPVHYRKAFANWTTEIEATSADLHEWNADLASFWKEVTDQNSRVPWLTRRFIEAWFDFALNGAGASLADNPAVRELILQRETRMKRGRARLTNPRALELWGGESGIARLSYRWRQAENIVLDILRGLSGDA